MSRNVDPFKKPERCTTRIMAILLRAGLFLHRTGRDC
jgi:hypothetical protein